MAKRTVEQVAEIKHAMVHILRINPHCSDYYFKKCFGIDDRTAAKYRGEIEAELRALIDKAELEQKKIDDEKNSISGRINTFLKETGIK